MTKEFSSKAMDCYLKMNFSFIDALSDLFGKRQFIDKDGFRFKYNKVDSNQIKEKLFYYLIPLRDGRNMVFGPYASEGFAKLMRNTRRITTFLDFRLKKPTAVMNGKELIENYPELFQKAQIFAAPLEYAESMGIK